MRPSAPATIQCPKCTQTLPGWSQSCQFCGSALGSNVVRPPDAYQYSTQHKNSWQEIAYIVCSALVLLNGIRLLLQSANIIPTSAYKFGGSAFMGISGSIDTALGLGLLFQQIWAQFLMKWICFIALLVLGAGFLLGLLTMGHRGGPSGLDVLFSVFELTLYGFMIYLIAQVGDA